MNILHISDLHFTPDENPESRLSQLSDDLINELSCRNLDALIISGDISCESKTAEYNLAEKFIKDLCSEFHLKQEQIAIVPGNHDLNWKLSKKGYTLIDKEDIEIEPSPDNFIPVNDEVIRLRDDKNYKNRFDNFSRFYHSITGDIYPQEYIDQGVIYIFSDYNLIILGLNSAWEIDHYYKQRASINPEALSRALNKIRTNPEFEKYLKFAVWHHPLHSPFEDRIKDYSFMQRLAQNGFCLCIHGHIHKAEKDQYQYYHNSNDENISIVAAGTFGAPIREWTPGYPLQYNLLKIDNNVLTVETRRRVELNGAWGPDAIWNQGKGKDPLPRFRITLLRSLSKKSTSTSVNEIDSQKNFPVLSVPEVYRKWLIDRCKYMDIDRMRERGVVIQVSLPEIFIPLYANQPKKEKFTDKEDSYHSEKENVYDIEDLINDNSSILIEGEAGSGKTTLLKHFAYKTIRDDSHNGDNKILPILLFLKDLKGYKCLGLPGTKEAESILEEFFDKTKNGLSVNLIKKYLASGSVFILLDGFDEIERETSDVIADSFADFRNTYPNLKIVLTARPNGIQGAVVDRFGDRHVKIHPLNIGQTEEFIRKWFYHIFESEDGICSKTAEEMIADVKVHPAIDSLRDTPLMLTAICMLYHDGKELPNQRAELYKKFIDNLLYKRFEKPEKVRRYLTELALFMHKNRIRNIDQAPAVEILGNIYPKKDLESDIEYFERIEKKFDAIEAHCGILKFENGQYSFFHLTFQEFLTSVALVDRERRNYFKAIEDLWETEWYSEVVELYIGYLSIQNMAMANEIVKSALEDNTNYPFNKWLLAGKALLGILKERREPQIIDLARDKMISIIDSDLDPKIRAKAGDTLGWLGDRRDLKAFIPLNMEISIPSFGEKRTHCFQMGKYPVTNLWFGEFVRDNGYKKLEYWTEEGKKWLAYVQAEHPLYWFDRLWNCPNSPVVGVCWYEADAFGKWLTANRDDHYEYRLPSAEEWVIAAANNDKRRYPWGNEWIEGCCNSEESGIGKTSAVGIFLRGNSLDRICDLSGNVWEWTKSDYHTKNNFNDFKFYDDIEELSIDWMRKPKKERQLLKQKIYFKLEDKSRQNPIIYGGSWKYNKSGATYKNYYRYNASSRFNTLSFRLIREKR